jgi:hypothetical protein
VVHTSFVYMNKVLIFPCFPVHDKRIATYLSINKAIMGPSNSTILLLLFRC